MAFATPLAAVSRATLPGTTAVEKRPTPSVPRRRARAAATIRMAGLEAPVKDDVRTNLDKLFAMPSAGEAETEFKEKRSKVDPGKMYKVMLFNDEGNERSYVARVIQKVCPEISPDQAWAIMMQAHKNGSAVVGIYSFEHAEMICQMLRENGLRSDISEA